jgi:DNA-binding CsgD family transcriptional regulator
VATGSALGGAVMTGGHESLELEQLLRIAGEVSLERGSPAERRRALARGLGRLVDASAWLWALWPSRPAGGAAPTAELLHAGLPRERLTAIARVCGPRPERGHGSPAKPSLGWDAQRMIEVVVSPEPDALSLVGLYRAGHEPAFHDSERRSVQLLLEGLRPLHRHAPLPPPQTPPLRLSPRRRSVLDGLVEGRSVKELAAALELSVHTVNDYRKELYRLLDVRTRAQLLRLFATGRVRLSEPLPRERQCSAIPTSSA